MEYLNGRSFGGSRENPYSLCMRVVLLPKFVTTSWFKLKRLKLVLMSTHVLNE